MERNHKRKCGQKYRNSFVNAKAISNLQYSTLDQQQPHITAGPKIECLLGLAGTLTLIVNSQDHAQKPGAIYSLFLTALLKKTREEYTILINHNMMNSSRACERSREIPANRL